jgi:hypothetical protein
MTLLDDLLPSYWNADLYLLRAACAATAGELNAMVESYAAAISQVQNEMKRSAAADDPGLTRRLDFATAALRDSAAALPEGSLASVRIEEILSAL